MNELNLIAGLCSTIAAGCLAMAAVLIIGNLVKAGKTSRKRPSSPQTDTPKKDTKESYTPDIEEKESRTSWKNAVIFFLLLSNLILMVMLYRK